jgi:uncharacterized membrane protein YfcA
VIKIRALGAVAGVFGGLFGIEGGLVIFPALVLIFGFDTKTPIGTSLFVILLSTGLLGVWQYWKNEELRITAGFWIAFGIFCGAYFRAQAVGSISTSTMKRLYALFPFVVATYFLFAPKGLSRRPTEPGQPKSTPTGPA